MKTYLLKTLLFFCILPLMSQSKEHQEMIKYLQENNIPVLGIIENAELKKIEVFGKLSANKKAPYNTIFNVASITKPVTALVALKLVSQGKWGLDEPLCKYWIDSDVKNDPNAKLLTTRHVLSHQTGFPNWRNGKLNFEFVPGTKYVYSGEGFEYLRKALESKFKKSLNDLATQLIFDPLQMTDTQYIWNEKIDSSRVALGYAADGTTYPVFKRKIPNGADDMLTTIKDYGTFLISVMNGEGLSDEVVKEMHSNQVASTNGKYFGLGFEKYLFKDGNYALAHGGSDNGVKALTFMFPKTKQGFLVFTNSDNGTKIFEKVLTKYLGIYGEEIIETEIGKKKVRSTINVLKREAVQKIENKELYNEILKMDSIFFEAYNNCDLKKQDALYADDIEFFHDKGGFMNSKKDIIEATKRNICGKVTRTLLKEQLEIYPIKDYGAIQIGYHKFYNNQEPKEESITVKFIVVWKNDNGNWKLKKVISLH
ncbi:serine hydrolase [Aquimarina agarilytica]|uniref:serine hydrolase n=1 Tax=Aquimarina agarilytica TaxID=1087449 RepID=UPI0002899D31|nr:serine hydrolase [Aquimarina agarilytica]